MMTTSEYRAYLADRRKQRDAEKRKPQRPWTPFLDWILAPMQAERTDSIGDLSRDIASECKRCERRLTQLNELKDLKMYCRVAPKSAHISDEIAKVAFREWAAHEQKKDAEEMSQ